MGKPGKEITTGIQAEVTATQEFLTAFTDWFKGLPAFFTEAHRIEAQANETLAEARAMKAPKTADDDAKVQAFIIDANANAKAAERHWSITQAASRLHKRLVERRGRAIEPNKAAAAIAQQLHNNYVMDERRKAIQKQDKLQAKENEKAEKTGTDARQIVVAPKVAEVGTDRTTWSGECFDFPAFLAAYKAGIVPEDAANCFTWNQAALTEKARSLHSLLDKWPGVRAISKTTTVA